MFKNKKIEEQFRKIVRNEIKIAINENDSAFAKGSTESKYTINDCLDEIAYQVNMAKKEFKTDLDEVKSRCYSIIHFAELCIKKIDEEKK